MFKIFVFVLVLVAAVSADYDFKDSDFNELLFDDLQSAFDDDFEESSRFRRDTEAAPEQKECVREKSKKDRDCFCCSGTKPDARHLEVMKDVKKECIAEVRGPNASSFDPFDCEKMQEMKEQTVCTMECVAKKFNLIDEHGDLKRENVLANLRAKIGNSEVLKDEAIEGFVDKCLGELKASKELESKEKENKEEKAGCNPCPLQFSHCIWREVVQGCPAEARIDNGKCKKIREGLAKGDTSFVNKSFYHHFLGHGHDHDEK